MAETRPTVPEADDALKPSEKSVEKAPSTDAVAPEPVPKTKKSKRFYAVMFSIMMAVFLSAIDLTAVSTALPTIASDLNMEASSYQWVGSAYITTSTAFMPWFGGFAMIYGRRVCLVAAILFFALGSALAGSAQNGSWIIAARAIQGVGGGGILSLSEIVITDLVPQAERAIWMSMLGLVWAVASCLGPPVGGALGQAYWPSLFYINLPLSGIALLLVGLFLDFKVPPLTRAEKFRKIDWSNLLFIAAIVSLLLGLAQGSSVWGWSSARTIVCIVLGALGLPLWILLQARFVAEPTLPWPIFSNRTALSGQLIAFFHGMLVLIFTFYAPVYAQAIKGASPVVSGLMFGPVALTIAPAAIAAGICIQITQRYRELNYAGAMLTMVGIGLFTLISSHFPNGQWYGFQIILGVGLGFLYSAPNFPLQSALDPKLHAVGVALLNFWRSFGQAAGVTVGSVLLTSKLNAELPADFAAMLPPDADPGYAAIPLIDGVAEPLRSQVRDAFGDALRFVFQVSLAFAGLLLLSVTLQKALPLWTEKDERFALKEAEDRGDVVAASAV